jgi:hypothetical protein
MKMTNGLIAITFAMWAFLNLVAITITELPMEKLIVFEIVIFIGPFLGMFAYRDWER